MPPFAATSNKPNRRQTAFEPADASSPSTLPPADSSLVAASQPQVAVDNASINTIIALTVIFGVIFVAFALFVIYWLYMRRLIQIEHDRALAEDVVWPGHRRYSRENHFRARNGGGLSAGIAHSGSDGSGYSSKPNPPLRMPSSSGSSEGDVGYSRYGEGHGRHSAPGNNGTRGQSKPQHRRLSSRGKPWQSSGFKGPGGGSPVSKDPQQQSEDERAFSKRSYSRPSAGYDTRRHSSASAETLRQRDRTPSMNSTNATLGRKVSPRRRPPVRDYSMPSIDSQFRSGWQSSIGTSRGSRRWRRPSTSPTYTLSLVESLRSSSARGRRQSFDSRSPFGQSPSASGIMYSEIGSLEQCENLPKGFHAAQRERLSASDTMLGGRLRGFSHEMSTVPDDTITSSQDGAWEDGQREDGLCASMTDETETA